MDAGFPMMDLPYDVIEKIGNWDVPEYVPADDKYKYDYDKKNVDIEELKPDPNDDNETRNAKIDKWNAIVDERRSNHNAVYESMIQESASALNAFRATCTDFCDAYRAKARELQIKFWIQKGPAIQDSLRLLMEPKSGGAVLELNNKASKENRLVRDYAFLDFENVRLEQNEVSNYKPEWTSMRDAAFTYSNRLVFDLVSLLA